MTVVDVIRVLHHHGEEVRAENFSSIFDRKSIEYIYRALELENLFNDLSRVKESTMYGSEYSKPISSAIRSSMIHSISDQREKDPEKKEIQRRIHQLVSGSITACRDVEESKLKASVAKRPVDSDSEDFDLYEFDPELNPDLNPSSSRIGGTSRQDLFEKSHENEDFLNENNLGLKIEKGALNQEFSMADYMSGKVSSHDSKGINRKMFDVSAALEKMKNEELKRIMTKYSNSAFTLSQLADLLVLLSCLFGKGDSQKQIERWVHRKSGEAYNHAADEKMSKKILAQAKSTSSHAGYDLDQGLKKTDLEQKVEEMNKMVREFFVKLD